MTKEVLIHFSLLIVLFALLTLFRGLIPNSLETLFLVLPLWIGGVMGTLLPDIDHLIYVRFLKPQELTSQRVEHLAVNKDLKGAVTLLSATSSERTQLIFHTAFFQIIFVVLTFLVVTSSASFLGRGLVLGFSLHLIVDQLTDMRKLGSITGWFKNLPISLNLNQQKAYIALTGILLLAFAFLF